MKTIKLSMFTLLLAGFVQTSCVANAADFFKVPTALNAESISAMVGLFEALLVQIQQWKRDGNKTHPFSCSSYEGTIKVEKKTLGYSVQFDIYHPIKQTQYFSPKDVFLFELALRAKIVQLKLLLLKPLLPNVSQVLKIALPVGALFAAGSWRMNGNAPSIIASAACGAVQAAGLYGLGHYCGHYYGWWTGRNELKNSPSYKEMKKVFAQKRLEDILAQVKVAAAAIEKIKQPTGGSEQAPAVAA